MKSIEEIIKEVSFCNQFDNIASNEFLEIVSKRYHLEKLKEIAGYQKATEAQKQPAMSLEECKDDMAKEHGYTGYNNILDFYKQGGISDFSLDDYFEDVCKVYANQFREHKWIPLPAKDLLPDGFYFVKIKHPITKIEDIVVDRIKNGLISYHYGIEYCHIPIPEAT